MNKLQHIILSDPKLPNSWSHPLSLKEGKEYFNPKKQMTRVLARMPVTGDQAIARRFYETTGVDGLEKNPWFTIEQHKKITPKPDTLNTLQQLHNLGLASDMLRPIESLIENQTSINQLAEQVRNRIKSGTYQKILEHSKEQAQKTPEILDRNIPTSFMAKISQQIRSMFSPKLEEKQKGPHIVHMKTYENVRHEMDHDLELLHIANSTRWLAIETASFLNTINTNDASLKQNAQQLADLISKNDVGYFDPDIQSLGHTKNNIMKSYISELNAINSELIERAEVNIPKHLNMSDILAQRQEAQPSIDAPKLK